MHMGVKVVFIGNPFAADDGIGPFLFQELKNHEDLQSFELLELGVIGFDLISYIEDNDTLIIVDAVHSDDDVGKVVLLGESDLTKDLHVVSQHDFGVEQTTAILRNYKPSMKEINFIGIKVSHIQPFSNTLSDELTNNIERIKQDVLHNIKKIANEVN